MTPLGWSTGARFTSNKRMSCLTSARSISTTGVSWEMNGWMSDAARDTTLSHHRRSSCVEASNAPWAATALNFHMQVISRCGCGLPQYPILPISLEFHKLSIACTRSEEHTSELQSPCNLVWRLLL